MDRRSFIKKTAWAMSTLALSCTTVPRRRSGGRPNIILIMADDLGYECLSCYGGNDYRTPHLDALAATGVRFAHCHSQPLCTPSRVQILTGQYNHRNYELFGYLDPRERTFANVLQDSGYATCIAGKWQLSGDADTVRGFGFDEHCLWNMHVYKDDQPDANEPESWHRRYPAPTLYVNGRWREHGADAYGPDVCCEFINDFVERNSEQPFLVYYPMILTHDPFVPTPDSANPTEEDAKRNFTDMVHYADRIVGRIAAHVDQLGLRDDTLIIFTGDNGTHRRIESYMDGRVIRGGKSKTIDTGTHVPLIANWGGSIPGGAVCDDLIDFSDFLPTLCEVAGTATPGDRVIDGRSFLPQVRGELGNPREWIYCHYQKKKQKKEDAQIFVRDQRWKLYTDGRFFDVLVDPLEEAPLQELSPEARAARDALMKAFEVVRTRR